jgi:urease subunit beta
VIPGEIIASEGVVALNDGRERIALDVLNTGDRPIQVGSHFHFADVNPALSFDRGAAQGTRLDLPAGSSSRFEPGMSKPVTLVSLGGERRVPGLQLRP